MAERLMTNREIRQEDDLADDEPLKAIADEAQKGGQNEYDPQRHVHKSQTRRPSKRLPQVRRYGEIVKLQLRYPEHRLQLRRIRREVEIGARKCLNPYGCDQYHPFARLRRHEPADASSL